MWDFCVGVDAQALAANRSEDGYILREDFLRYFALPGLIGGVLCRGGVISRETLQHV